MSQDQIRTPVTPTGNTIDPTTLINTSMTSAPMIDPQQYLVRTRVTLLSHPLAVRDWNDLTTYPLQGTPASEALTQVDLMPARSASIDEEIGRSWQTVEEAKNEDYLASRYPGVAAVFASSTMSKRHMELAAEYEDTYRDCLENEVNMNQTMCGSLLTLSVLYSTSLCLDRDYVRENLGDYLKILCDNFIGASLIFFQQIASDKIIKSPGFRALCEAIDEEEIFDDYLRWRLDREELLESSALFKKATESFQSLSEEEIRFIADEAKANALNHRYVPRYCYTPHHSSESGTITDSDMQNVMTTASALALFEGAPQIEAAEQLLTSDRLFGLTAFSLLTSPWYQDDVRATALRRMAQEDPIVGREMAKIVLVRDEIPVVLEAAREILA